MVKETYNYILKNLIQNSPDKCLLTEDIIKYMKANHSFINNKPLSIKTIRHTLSFKNIFIKSEKNVSGRGYYWKLSTNEQDYMRQRKKISDKNADNNYTKNKRSNNILKYYLSYLNFL